MLVATVTDLEQIKTPALDGDVGFDLVAAQDPEIQRDKNGDILYIQYDTQLRIQPPAGYFTLLFPRSSISKTNLVLANSVGVIDQSYRGNILVRFKYISTNHKGFPQNIYKKGDRIAQLVFMPAVIPALQEGEVDETLRNSSGFGSTGS
jgi:dUTP pyrophosphatase